MENIAAHPLPAYNLVGGRVHPVSHRQILEQIADWVYTRQSVRMIVVANTHVVMESRIDTALKRAVSQADLVIPDGMPLVIAGRVRGFPETQRADGPTLLVRALEESKKHGWRHSFFGSTPPVLEAMQAEINRTYPEVQVAGAISPPFRALSPEEDEAMIQQINASGADILWVGLGCPKQEIWMYEHRDRLQVPVMVGVGMAFDILAGSKPRAPRWMQTTGLEWLFRLLTEPRRLWKRYLKYNTLFLVLASMEQVKYWWGQLRGN